MIIADILLERPMLEFLIIALETVVIGIVGRDSDWVFLLMYLGSFSICVGIISLIIYVTIGSFLKTTHYNHPRRMLTCGAAIFIWPLLASTVFIGLVGPIGRLIDRSIFEELYEFNFDRTFKDGSVIIPVGDLNYRMAVFFSPPAVNVQVSGVNLSLLTSRRRVNPIELRAAEINFLTRSGEAETILISDIIADLRSQHPKILEDKFRISVHPPIVSRFNPFIPFEDGWISVTFSYVEKFYDGGLR